MRNFMKCELVENIKILQNTNDAMNRNRKVLGPAERLEILGKCQDSAINMGTRIEETEGEGTATVGLLEQYCELLYQISQVINDNIKLEKLKSGGNLEKGGRKHLAGFAGLQEGNRIPAL